MITRLSNNYELFNYAPLCLFVRGGYWVNMGYFNSRGLRGSMLEDLINRTNKEYFDDELAVIQKLPTSIKPVELDSERGVISLAYFDAKSTVDYMGNVQGVPVCFDAKETAQKSFPIANIHKHQIDFMDKFSNQGGLSFMIVSFTKLDEIYLLDLETIKQYWSASLEGGRKSIPYSAFNKDYKIDRVGRYLIHYLEALSLYTQN